MSKRKARVLSREQGKLLRHAIKGILTTSPLLSNSQMMDRLYSRRDLRSFKSLVSKNTVTNLMRIHRSGTDIASPGYRALEEERLAGARSGISSTASQVHEHVEMPGRLEPTECVCGLKGSSGSIHSHKGYCSKWKVWLKETALNEAVVDEVKNTCVGRTAKMLGVSSSTLRRAMITAGTLASLGAAESSVAEPSRAEVRQTNEPVKESPRTTILNPTPQQIIDSIAWMASELKKAQSDVEEFMRLNRELAARNKKLSEDVVRIGKKLRDEAERRVELHMAESSPEDSLTGVKRNW